MKKRAQSARGRRGGKPRRIAKTRSVRDDKRIKSKRTKRKSLRKKKKKLSAEALLARQKHNSAVVSVFYTIAITALLVIGLMLLTIAAEKPLIITQVEVHQVLTPEDKPTEPAKKSKVQLSSSRPQLPSAKIIKSRAPSLVSIPRPKLEVPSLDFNLGADIDGLDFGNGQAGAGNGQKGSLGGMSITASQLGVILDVSGSMSDVLPILEKEIIRDFPWSLVRRVTGCSMREDIDEVAIEDPNDTISAIKNLVQYGEVDAIFWFSDLQDTRAPESVLKLEKYLRKHKVKLYICSTSERPDTNLMKATTKFSRWKPSMQKRQ